MKQILVTGADGQLGRCLRKIEHAYSGLAFDFLNAQQCNITDAKKVDDKFQKGDYDYCINCAAYTDVEGAEKNPELSYAINSQGVQNIAHACQENNTILIHISTDYVFDGEKKTGYTVNDMPNPINEYGKSKWEGEKHIQEIMDRYFIIRTSWLYSEFGKNFYTSILKKARVGETLHITDEQKGCPTDANNLAAHILRIVTAGQKNYGILHFTDSEVMTWFEFAHKILKENGLLGKIDLKKAKDFRSFAKRPRNSILL